MGSNNSMTHPYTENQLVEQPAIDELTRDLLLPRLLSGQIDLSEEVHIG